MRVMLDRGAREIDGVTGQRYHAKDGVFDMDPRDAKALKEIGGAVCGIGPVSASRFGYRCPDCGFGSWFKTCSKCGADTVREQLATC